MNVDYDPSRTVLKQISYNIEQQESEAQHKLKNRGRGKTMRQIAKEAEAEFKRKKAQAIANAAKKKQQPGLGCRPDSTNATCIGSGAAMGAAVGSIVPVLGTGVGACVGAACGLGAAVKRRFTGKGRNRKTKRKHKRKTRHKRKHKRKTRHKRKHKRKRKTKRRRVSRNKKGGASVSFLEVWREPEDASGPQGKDISAVALWKGAFNEWAATNLDASDYSAINTTFIANMMNATEKVSSGIRTHKPTFYYKVGNQWKSVGLKCQVNLNSS